MKPDAKQKFLKLAEEFIMRNDKPSVLVAVQAINTMGETGMVGSVVYDLDGIIAAAEEFKRRLLELGL